MKGGDDMKVKVIKSFNDLQNDLLTRNVGDVYECSDERAAELKTLGFVTEYAEEPVEEPKEKPKTKPKK